ncbi:MAG: DUF3038 domain-containing protein [Cyanobacteria bacterium J06621_12]
MPINIRNNSQYSQWQELADAKVTQNKELENIKCHLDLVLLALEAIADISSDAIVQAAEDLNLTSVIGDRLTLWRLRTSNPKRKTTGGRKKLDVEEARSLVLIICYLARQHQELLRRGVSLLEQVVEQKKVPHHTALLGNYLDRFIDFYQARIADSQDISSEFLANLAWKLLGDLLFYSSQNGHRLLWVAIFDAAQANSD